MSRKKVIIPNRDNSINPPVIEFMRRNKMHSASADLLSKYLFRTLRRQRAACHKQISANGADKNYAAQAYWLARLEEVQEIMSELYGERGAK